MTVTTHGYPCHAGTFDTSAEIADNRRAARRIPAATTPTLRATDTFELHDSLCVTMNDGFPSRQERTHVIKAIFFDYDGVLTTDKTGSLTTNKYLSKMTAVEFETLRRAFAPYNQALLVGQTTHGEIWDAICEEMHCTIDFALLEQAFLSTPTNDSMFALAHRLRHDYRLGIITDNKKDRIDCLRKSQDLDSLFNPIVVSAEFGSGKDGPAVFEHALRCLEVKPEESVFIDNNPDNLVAPRALGMGVIYHDDERNDVDKLAAILRDEFLIQLGR
ncbi:MULTISPECIES: HAD-IA family hydrolase [Burkholderia]|uniref:HAD-IA family hydrolase n=1 Tax=Burkholderia TaxID=32008 RepID=UPI001F284230|nr:MULTISPECIES: HAD-IA family hydrolase [Burkholderia]